MPRTTLALLALLCLLAGCGGDAEEPTAGATGASGASGASGATGADATGTTGAAGATGVTGATAATGATGATGAAAPALVATLTGVEEIPGPGHESATGQALVRLTATEVCVTLTTDLQGITAAHIHEGATGVAGPPVVDLTSVPATGTELCLAADPALIGRIGTDPGAFYVNLHTAELPDGAIRGQLRVG